MRLIKAFLVNLLALALFWASPALAGFTQVTGGGTGGAVIASTSGTTTATGTLTSALNAKDVLIIYVQDANSGSRTFGCSDAFGNTYQAAPGGGFQNGAAVEFWYSILTNPISNSSTISCTTTSSGFLIAATAWRPAGTASFDVNATAQSNSGTTITNGPTPSVTCPAGASNCDICVGGGSWHASGTITGDASYTTFSGTGGTTRAAQYKLISSVTTTTQTLTSTTSANYAGALACFKDTPAAGPTNKKVMMRSTP